MDSSTGSSSGRNPTIEKPAVYKQPRFQHIKGWGADLNHDDRPAYPKERKPPRLEVIPSQAPAQQQRVEVFHSNERPSLTPVFGTSVPPSGISGRLRSWAFKFSENDVRHWLLLLLADRVNMGEGLVSDLAHGHVPNIYKEVGGPAAFRYDRANTIKQIAIRTAVLTAVVGGAVYWMRRRRR